MKKYTIPELKISRFSVSDIITASDTTAAEATVKSTLQTAGVASVNIAVADWSEME